MTAAFKPLDTVQLKEAIPAEGLVVGAFGCVLEVFDAGAAYLVEFANGNGETIAIVTLKTDDITPMPITA